MRIAALAVAVFYADLVEIHKFYQHKTVYTSIVSYCTILRTLPFDLVL